MEIRNYIRNERRNNEIKEAEVCMGLCSRSQFRNYENGHRDLNFFTQKRAMERLGCSCGGMQFLLKKEEYKCWAAEMAVLYDLMEGKLENVCADLEYIREEYGKNAIHQQFVERMLSFYCILKQENPEEVALHVENALKCTVPNYKNVNQLNQLMAAAEWDMLLDYYNCVRTSDFELFKAVAYEIQNSSLVVTEKAIVYPKAIIYCDNAMKLAEKEITATQMEELLEMARKGMEYNKMAKSDCLIKEMLEIQIRLLEFLQDDKESNEEKCEIELVKSQLEASSYVLKKVGHVGINYYPYLCRNVEEVCTVLTKRMDMLGLEDQMLAEECVIDPRTIGSIRAGEYNPHKEIVEILLEKLGLPKSYSQQLFFIDSREQKEKAEKFIALQKYGTNVKLDKMVGELEDGIDTDIRYNQLELEWHKIWTEYKEKYISKDEGAKRLKGLIEKCFPWECLADGRIGYYFSYRELQYMCGYLILENPKCEDYKIVMNRIESYCLEALSTNQGLNRASALTPLLDSLQSTYGNERDFERSNYFCNEALKIAYRIGNAHGIEDILYAMWWNKCEQTKITDAETLSWLIEFAGLIGDESGRRFMEQKLKTNIGSLSL